jgi:hypothetical protein
VPDAFPRHAAPLCKVSTCEGDGTCAPLASVIRSANHFVPSVATEFRNVRYVTGLRDCRTAQYYSFRI